MSQRLPRISGKDVKKALLRQGFKLVHIRGSHHYFETPEEGNLITVPVHLKKVIKPKTLKSILKQAGLSIEELKNLL